MELKSEESECPISPDSVYKSVAYDPVRNRLLESEAGEKTNQKAWNPAFWLAYSYPFAFDSDNVVFTRS